MHMKNQLKNIRYNKGYKAVAKTVAAAILTLVALLPIESFAASGKWETLKTERSDAKTVIRDSELEIKAARGVIVVTSSRPVQIKVYTILGQLISRENLPAGSSQLNVQAHGVYIIKTGELTCKVAL